MALVFNTTISIYPHPAVRCCADGFAPWQSPTTIKIILLILLLCSPTLTALHTSTINMVCYKNKPYCKKLCRFFRFCSDDAF